jgi:ParB-like chromosome segregation protein Spo0J
VILLGHRYSKDEIGLIGSLVDEGLTDREIALKLGRSEAGIRNLRYRISLVKKVEDEMKTLLLHRDTLREAVKRLQHQQQTLTSEIPALEKKKQEITSILNLDTILLQNVLAQALTTLKLQRPDLFDLSREERAC